MFIFPISKTFLKLTGMLFLWTDKTVLGKQGFRASLWDVLRYISFRGPEITAESL